MTPLVLLHFMGSSRNEWDLVRARLPRDAVVVALDLPGFGDAAGIGAMDVAGMADAVDARIREAGIDDCIVAGHSMSGKVAMLLAARQPRYLRGLVLVASSPPSPEPIDDDARTRLLSFDGTREAAADYIDGMTAGRLPDGPRELAIADAMRASPSAWRAWVTAGSQEDLEDDIGMLPIPALVIGGVDDPSLGVDIQRARVMPHLAHAGLVAIPGGHALPLENPNDLVREIERFDASPAMHTRSTTRKEAS